MACREKVGLVAPDLPCLPAASPCAPGQLTSALPSVPFSCALSNVKKVSLELGGKSPLIIFADCDLNKAVQMVSLGLRQGWVGTDGRTSERQRDRRGGSLSSKWSA